jgi:Meiotically up-regulated gene 113
MREEILKKIQELAKANGGQPPGRMVFERETGIRSSAWFGVYWARWGDALIEAGFSPNAIQKALPEDFLLEKIAAACRHFGHIPTYAEMRIYAAGDETFPSHNVISTRLPKAKMIARLREWTAVNEGYADVAAMLPAQLPETQERAKQADGHVYLIAYGQHFKIGRSDELERRVKQVQIALPEAGKLVHAIRTDDPAGIEVYWHNRFADKRANGEWFKLTRADVAAFKRRKYQ